MCAQPCTVLCDEAFRTASKNMHLQGLGGHGTQLSRGHVWLLLISNFNKLTFIN